MRKGIIGILMIIGMVYSHGYSQNGSFAILDGVDDYMQVADHSDLDIDAGENFTIVMWVKSTNTSNYFRFADKRDGSGYGYELINSINTGYFGVNLTTNTGVASGPPFGTNSILDGNWHNIAMVVDVTSIPGSVICNNYVDGVLDQTNTSVNSNPSFASTSDLYFGSNLSEFFELYLDDISVWSKAMSVSEINANITAVLAGNETDLLAAWDFENVTGVTVPDLTPNLHSGTLVGGLTIFDPSQDQIIELDPIADKYATDVPFNLNATVTSGLPITYSIVSGPATILGNTVTLTGTGGVVAVEASQAGNGTYNAVSDVQSFTVVDLSTIAPTLTTKLTGAHFVEMPTLKAYPIYVNTAITEPNALNVASVEMAVDGQTISAIPKDGYFIGWWTPSDYGVYDVDITATASNGMATTETVSVEVVNSVSTQNVQTFDNDLIEIGTAGQWFYGNYTLPQSVGAYNQIMANFSVTCPNISGGCDDWDRLAYVQYKAPDGNWMELFRYITPYGVACNHSIDVTDYASLLQGNTEIRMYIETWGTGGWNISLDFDYSAGTPDYLYSHIEEIWHGNYSFGNPSNLQPLDTATIEFPDETEKATFRVTTTGHGWGSNNTGNAAEFYEANHNFNVNNVQTYSQHLWNDCNPNPDNCTGQLGTWTYNRAGWCPGTIAPPHAYDLTSLIPHGPFEFSYIFQNSYMDQCHPNNPSCVSGVTCDNCNDGYNPYYRVGGYMITYSNSKLIAGVKSLEDEAEFDFTAYPNPSNGNLRLEVSKEVNDFVITIMDISGKTYKTYFYKNSSDLQGKVMDLSDLSDGVYFVKIQTQHQVFAKQIILNK